MKKKVLVPGVSAFLRPCARRATSFEHALSQKYFLGPSIRCLYSNWSPVTGHWTELTEWGLRVVFVLVDRCGFDACTFCCEKFGIFLWSAIFQS